MKDLLLCKIPMLDSYASQKVISILGFVLTAVAFFLVADVALNLRLLIYIEQQIAIMLGLALAIGFLRFRARPGNKNTSVPWYDVVLCLFGLGIGLFLAIRYPALSRDFFQHPVETAIAGFILIPLMLETLRRTSGLGLFVIVLACLAYGLGAHLVPGTLQGRPSEISGLLAYLAIDSTSIFGTPLIIVSTIVVVYMFFGRLLLETGTSEWFTDLAIAMVGKSRGGAAKIAVVASALFGSISGSAVANVASTGVITIPLMTRSGFNARVAGAFEAVASTGGQIMPPVMGAAAFLMAEFLQTSYGSVVMAALVPATLYFLAVLVQADLQAARHDIPPIPDDMIKPIGEVLKAGWYMPLPFVVLITALFGWNMSASKAALWGSGTIVLLNLLFGYRGQRINFSRFIRSIAITGAASVDIIVVGAAAGIVIGVLEKTGLSFGLTFLLVQFGQGNLLLLLVLTAIICIILGMGMPTTGIYLLVATLAAPPLIELGVDPMAAHMFILYMGLMSMITPPVAVAAFTAASIAKAGPMATAITSVRLAWPAFIVPFLFVYSPNLMLRGDPWLSALATGTALIGVWLVSAGAVGYLKHRLNWWERILFLAAGFGLLIPSQAFPAAPWVELIGAGLASIGLFHQFMVKQPEKTIGTPPNTP